MTEITPGMMVECIKPYGNLTLGSRYILKTILPKPRWGECNMCVREGFPIELIHEPSVPATFDNWCICQFKPIGGDKEIERELFETNPPKKLKIYYCE